MKLHNDRNFHLCIEEDVQTTSIFKRIPCSIIAVFASNDFVLSRDLGPFYKGLEGKKRDGLGGFIRDNMIGDDFFILEFTSTRQVNVE